MKCCPTCGRQYPPKLQVRGPVRQRLVNILVKRPYGVEMSDLIDLVYADSPDGAPASASNCINVMAHMANKELKPLGWRITASKGRGSRYRLVTYADTVRQRTRDRDSRAVERFESTIEKGVNR